MRWSKTFIPTLKEVPAEAEIPSHRLMIRAGLIRKLASGAYTYLPLGYRALLKATAIVREEMDAAGAIEVHMPAIQPVELWEESGRFQDYGEDLMQLKDRHGRRMALGPTHEEVVTDLVRNHIQSYRQLPLTFYQIQTKFRDEIRPRFGVLRSREFLMKDAYSFDVDVDALNVSYDLMYRAYCRIFDRCGLDYVVVEAESGPIGGDVSHEFMVPTESGEDAIVRCEACGYAANLERAEVGATAAPQSADAPDELEVVDTPGATTIEHISRMLGCGPERMIKTLILMADESPLAVLVRGDHDLNEVKLKRFLGADAVTMADPDTIRRVTGAPVGFAGPVGLKARIVADQAVPAIANGVTGANDADKHLTGVNTPRDFQASEVGDLRFATDGDPCPRCGARLTLSHGIEVGHVFKLGTKYSDALGALYQDADGNGHPIVMGCYGIGVNRILAARIEDNYDKDGIVWSQALAPYDVEVLPLNMANAEVSAAAEKIYGDLQQAGLEALMDDRDARPGFKFKDADLIGLPHRVVVGDRTLAQGCAEIQVRADKTSVTVPLDQVVEKLLELRSV